MIKIVPDTNIYISALNFGGVADDVLLLARKREVETFISQPILEEIKNVLFRKFRWTKTEVSGAADSIMSFATMVYPEEELDVIKEDEADNRILECAEEAKADYIVTGDKHLLKLKEFKAVTLVKPSQFLKITI